MTVVVPLTLDGALDVLADAPGALVLAGGTDAMVEVNDGRLRLGHLGAASTVVVIDRVAEMRSWSVDHGSSTVTIGAGVTWTELLAEPLCGLLPALADAARTVGSPQIRNVGTLGGNLGTCSPAGDGLPVLAALDAVVHLASASGARMLPIGEFMLGVKRSARAPDELITAVTVPLLDGWQGYAKVGVRNAMVIATASACLAVDQHGRGVRLALGSVGPTVLRCPEAERFVADRLTWTDAGPRLSDPADAAAFGELAASTARPIDDHRATADYRRHAVAVMARRLLNRAVESPSTRSRP